MIALAAVLAAFAAPQSADPPQCSPRTVVTAPSTPIALAPDCTGTGANPTVTVITPPVGGTLKGFPGQYTPSAGFNGADHLIYTVKNNDTGETSAATTINLLVTAGRPSCADGVATTPANTPLKLSFACSEPNGGTVLIRAEDGRHGVVDPKVGTALTYTPEPGYVGTDEISFRGFTGAFETPPRTLTITITAPPSATPSPGPTASATPAPTASAPAADTTAPSVSVKVAKASVAKGVAITLRSNEAGTVKLTLAARKHTATKSAKLVNGTTKVTLKLSAKARKALKSTRRVTATLTVASTDAAGNRVTKKMSVPLRR